MLSRVFSMAELSANHKAAAVSRNLFAHLHETNCRKTCKTSRSSVQNANHPPQASFAHPIDEVMDKRLFVNLQMTGCKMACFTSCCEMAFNSMRTLFTFSMLLN